MKFLIVLLICFYFINFIKSECSTEDGYSRKIRDDDDCKKRALSDEEKELGNVACCYYKAKIDSPNFKGKEYGCIPLTQSEVKNIDQYIKFFESSKEVKDVDIDCKSSNTFFSFLIFLSLIFL